MQTLAQRLSSNLGEAIAYMRAHIAVLKEDGAPHQQQLAAAMTTVTDAAEAASKPVLVLQDPVPAGGNGNDTTAVTTDPATTA
jgi:hypothetical protein